MKRKSIKVIFDTNIWISFLIGKRLSNLKKHLVNRKIVIITTSQLIEEIKIVTSRPKLSPYFSKKDVDELLNLLDLISINIEITNTHFLNRDPKDNFLFDLIDYSKADYLITGDKDLLEHTQFKTAKILSPTKFEKLIETPNF